MVRIVSISCLGLLESSSIYLHHPEVFVVCDLTVFCHLPYRTLIPLFDQDTNALFLAGKGDNNVRFFECTNKDPFLIEGINLI